MLKGFICLFGMVSIGGGGETQNNRMHGWDRGMLYFSAYSFFQINFPLLRLFTFITVAEKGMR